MFYYLIHYLEQWVHVAISQLNKYKLCNLMLQNLTTLKGQYKNIKYFPVQRHKQKYYT